VKLTVDAEDLKAFKGMLPKSALEGEGKLANILLRGDGIVR